MFEQLIQSGIQQLVVFATNNLMVSMVTVFVAGVFVRWILYYSQKLATSFVREFEKRLYMRLNEETNLHEISFFRLVKSLLEQTYFEYFELRARHRRRTRLDDNDNLKIIRDRVLLIQDGCALLVKDTLKQVRYMKLRRATPNTLDIAKSAFDNNQAFSKCFGVFSAPPVNGILETLPGLFIVAGIFGTFLGIMQALPELRGMDISDVEQTKIVMDAFLLKVSFALSSSILGITLSVLMGTFNSMFDPESVYLATVERYASCLKVAWNRSVANKADDDVTPVRTSIEPTEREMDAEEALHDFLQRRKYAATEVFVFESPGTQGEEIVTPRMEDVLEMREQNEHTKESIVRLPSTSSHHMDSVAESETSLSDDDETTADVETDGEVESPDDEVTTNSRKRSA